MATYFKEFPADNREYQLCWIGNIVKSRHIENSYSVKTYFRENVSVENSYKLERSSFVIDLPIEAIQMLRLGSIWQNGKIVGKGKLERLLIERVRFNENKTRIISASSSYAPDRFYIPSYLYPLSKEAKQSKILTFENNGKSKSAHDIFVLPTSEIFRFEYTNSSNLSHLLMLGDWASGTDGLYNPNGSYYSEREKTHYIKLRQKALNVDTPLIARFFFSEYARKCLNIFRKYFRTCFAGSGESPFFCYPPFEEAVDLVVHGKTLQTKDKKIFLIYWIETSTSPFPFINLKRSRDNSGAKGNEEAEELKPYGIPQKAKSREDTEEKPESNPQKPISTNEEKSKEIQTIWENYTSNRFSALENVKISEDEKPLQTHFGVRQPETDASHVLSMQGGAYGMDCLSPYGIAETLCGFDEELRRRQRREALPANLEIMRKVLHVLQEKYSISVETIRLFSRLLPDTDDSSYIQGSKSWCFIDGRQKRKRRQILVVKLELNNSHIYLLELEKREPHKDGRERERFASLLIWKENFDPWFAFELEHLVRKCTEKEGWISENEMIDIRRKRLFHTSSEIEEFAEKIFNEISATIEVSAVKNYSIIEEIDESEIISFPKVA